VHSAGRARAGKASRAHGGTLLCWRPGDDDVPKLVACCPLTSQTFHSL
jgi:hypothetical protein